MADATKTKPHVPPVDEEWLAQDSEPPLPTAMEVVDSHIHLWDFSTPPYFGDTYRADANKSGISASVFVECTMAYRDTGPDKERVVGEVEFARKQAERHSSSSLALNAAIVGMVDVTLGDRVVPVLEMLDAASDGRLRGIRIRAAHDPDPTVGYGEKGVPAELLGQAEVLTALKKLHAAGHSLDVYAFHTQLPEVEALARRLPDLPIVVNHIGGPLGVGPYAQIPEEVRTLWMKNMASLATCENVHVKIGGFAISRINIVSASGRQAPPSSQELEELFRPWFDHCLETFGARRCMFGSNFPVDKNAMTLTTLVNAIRRLSAKLSGDEASALLAGTARRFYRI